MRKNTSANSTVNTVLCRTFGPAGSVPIWLWIILAPAILARLVVAWSSTDTLIGFSTPDDAYYYFTIARNIARGYGVTFDGLTPTNGFHPLWMSLITPIWWLGGRSVTIPINLTLTLGVAFDIVTMLGILRLARFVTGNDFIAGLAVIVYAWNPYNLAASVNGLETSLAAISS